MSGPWAAASPLGLVDDRRMLRQQPHVLSTAQTGISGPLFGVDGRDRVGHDGVDLRLCLRTDYRQRDLDEFRPYCIRQRLDRIGHRDDHRLRRFDDTAGRVGRDVRSLLVLFGLRIAVEGDGDRLRRGSGRR